MAGLINLLTILAALLNLTTGCGLGASGITGRQLLRLGSAIATRRLSAGTAGVPLGRVGAVLSRTSAGGLVMSGASGITSTGTTSGLQTGVGALGAGLGGGTSEVLLAGLQKLAGRMQSGGSRGSIVSGSSIAVSGGQSTQQLGQLLPQPGQVIGAGFIQSSHATSSATGFQTSMGGISSSNLPAVLVPQGASGPLGGAPSAGRVPGSTPTISGPVGVQAPQGGVPRAGAGAVLIRGVETVHAASLQASGPSPGSIPGQNNIGSGQNPLQSPGQALQPIDQTLTGGSLAALSEVTNSASHLGTHLGRSTASNVPGNGFPSSTNPGQVASQSLRQASRVVAAGHLATVGATSHTATNLGANLAGNAVGNVLDGVGALTGVNELGSSTVASGRGQGAQGAVYGPRTGGAFPGGNGALPEGGFRGVTNSAGHISRSSHTISETEVLQGTVQGQELRHSPQQPGIPLARTGASPSGASGHLQGTTSNTNGITFTEGIATGQIDTVQRTRAGGISMGGIEAPAASGVNRPGSNGGIISGASGTVSGSGILAGVNTGVGLGQSMNHISQTLRGGLLAAGGTNGNQAPGFGILPRGNSGHIQGTSAIVSSTSSFGATSSSRTSRTTFTGTGSDGNLGQVLGQGTRPTSPGPNGGSVVSVTASSHSASSFQAHLVGNPRGHLGNVLPGLSGSGPNAGPQNGAIVPGSTGAGRGGALLDAIVAAGTGGGTAVSPGTIPGVGSGGLSSSGASVLGSGGTISAGIPQRIDHSASKPSAAAAVGIALGGVAGALAIGAIGATVASAMHSGGLGQGRRIGGCSRGGCSHGCGRKRRSLSQSKVPAEVLDNIPINFDRLY